MRSSRFPSLAFAIAVAASYPCAALAAPEGYYRFPAISGETLVFSAESDLWTVSLDGGLARRLTTHAGEETHASISPDGSTVAFSATYEGPTEVYTMPIDGGLPQRRTWEDDASTVIGWTPAGELVYSTTRYSTLPDALLVRLQLDSMQRRLVPLAQASDGDWTADGSELFFARPAFHRNNTRRYRGGTARNIWYYAGGAEEAVNLTADFAGENHSPMVLGDRIYFVNDRDGTMNIWSMGEQGSDLHQHTFHSGWDVESPDGDSGRIVYQLGADLWRLDLATGVTAKIDIRLASDFDQLREKWVRDPQQWVTAFDIHPEGESIALTARGRIFLFPTRSGRRVQLAPKGGVRYRDAVYLPGTDDVVFLGDQTGELEFYRTAASGLGESSALTSDGEILRFRPLPSPDGHYLAYDDKNSDLWILDLESGEQTKLNQLREGIGDFAWSPDSRFLAFEAVARNTYRQLILYDLDGERQIELTSDRTNSMSPVFSPDGKWLYFLSDRNLRSLVGSPWGPRQPEPYFDRPIEIFQIALESGLRPTFRAPDELAPAVHEESKGEASSEAGEREDGDDVRVQLDVLGIATRLWRLPIPAGNYSSLSITADALFWLRREGRDDTDLVSVQIEPEAKPVTVAEGVRGYRMSADRKHLLLRREDDFYVVPAESTEQGSKLEDHQVDLEGWSFPISVREDFRQLFVDAWRLERDYFYDPGMHGVDWDAVRDRYLPLVDRVTTRAELSDLIGEVVAELSALHVSVRGGDLRRGEDRVRVASLGARLERDASTGGYRVDYIYRTEPDYPQWRSPLADPAAGVEVGDTILAIDGSPVLAARDLSELLRDRQGRQVLLRYRSASSGEERSAVVVPTDDESGLRYSDWEYTRRLQVENRGGGDIGYVHLRAMGSNDLSQWYRNFYPVFDRRGLIIDVRHNRGGNIDSILLEKLLRRAWFYWQGRVGEPYWNMQYAFRGHMVVLVDEFTASDGEAFAEGFRRLGLGKIIGTRTWGGEIWLSSNNRLSDGGLARAPQTGVYGPERQWLIENHGVDPDIVVDNLPHETFLGRDAQLDAAIAHLQELIEQDPRDVPAPPPYPDKSFSYPVPTEPTAGSRP